MNRLILVLTGMFVAVVVMLFLLARPERRSPGVAAEPLMMFCAASNQSVMEAIRADYQTECGREVHINYGPSQALLSQIEISKTGDLFLPADDSYLEMAHEKKLVAERLNVARMKLVVAVKRGNSMSIQSLDDLFKDEVRLVQANPDAAAVGKVTRSILQETNQWDAFEQATVAFRGTVTEVANDLVVGAADAGIVYDAVLHPYPDLEFIELEEFEAGSSQIAVGIVAGSTNATAALHFARYITASDRGQRHYANHGFRTSPGDEWASSPELTLFAGSMLRPAIEETVVEFEQREGVSVNRVYNGCGILVAQMKAGQIPDAYFACDEEFMTQVSDEFTDAQSVSQNELVILVKKGNPFGIASLKDLAREGVRVGIGHEKQCAMGWITQNTLRDGGVQSEVMANVKVQTPTGDMLVNQLKTGSLDAAVAYLSNAAGSADSLDAVQITGIECSVATQPWAVATGSPYPHLAKRLFDRITSEESQEIFAAEGFRWQLEH